MHNIRNKIVGNVLKTVGWMLCLSAGMTLAQTTATLPPPELTVPHSEKAPVMDGILDDACWKQGAEIRQFYILGQKGKTTSEQRFRLVFDNQWLYLAAEITHPMPKQIKPKVVIHDGPVHTDDSIQIFIDPGTDGKFYYHYLLNAANVRAEQRKFKTASGEYDGDRQWDVPWRSATKITEKGWQAEVAIPMSVLAAQSGLGRLRMNIVGSVQAVGNQSALDFTWAPLTTSFHEPVSFGALRGLEQAKPEAAFLPTVRWAETGNYIATNGQYGYEVKAELQGYSPVTGAVKLVVTDEPLVGVPANVSKTVRLNGLDIQRPSVFVPISMMGSRTAKVTLIDTSNGELLQTIVLTDLARLSLMTGLYVDRSYYTTETQALVGCRLSLPETALKGCELRVRDAKDKTLGSIKAVKVNPLLPLALDSIPTGYHQLKLELVNAQGQPTIRQSFELIKRAPKPGCEWKLDNMNGVLLRDGEPFFPSGLIMAGKDSRDDEDFKKVSEMGFNSVLQWIPGRPVEEARAYQDTAAKYGLNVMGYIDGYFQSVELETNEESLAGPILEHARQALRHVSPHFVACKIEYDPVLRGLPRETMRRLFDQYVEKNLPRIIQAVNGAKEYKNLIGFFLFDEPGDVMYGAGKKIYDRIREVDGYRPVFVNYSSCNVPDPTLTLSSEWCDFFGADPYWVPGEKNEQYPGQVDVNWVSRVTALLKARADRDVKATWVVPMAEYWSGCRKRALTPQEQYCQTYLALIHGAKAIFYFRWPVNAQASVDALTEVARQLKVLGPIAVTPDVPQEIQYDPGRIELEKNDYSGYPDVQVSLRRNPAGGYVLLAANSRPYPVNVTYAISCENGQSKVGRLFAGERYRMNAGAFSDRIEPYGVRAYTLNEKLKPRLPVLIKVSMVAHPQEGTNETVLSPTGRPGKKNIACNPGFEEATLAGWPYYYWPYWANPLIGAENASWGLDSSNPYEGKYCLKIVKNLPDENGFMSSCVPKPEKETKYVFSVYLKADREGVEAEIRGPSATSKKVKLTTTWQRYSVAGPVPAGGIRYSGIRVCTTLGGAGRATVWVDAIQVEQGSKATAFEP